MRHDTRGSMWRRWDLHVHTPSSYDYQFRAAGAKQIVDTLISSDIEVVAITDHHVINVDLIREMQEIGAGKLTVLPGIELRSELGGSRSVHYTGIFPENCNLEETWMKLQSFLEITRSDVTRKGGDERIYAPFAQGCTKIRQLGGIVSVHAGVKSNSLEQLSNADVVKQEVKTDLVSEHVHMYEIGNPDDCEGYRSKVFPCIEKELPLILCSDNHDIRDYTTKCPMWIKADPCFAGLLQVLNEPADRIFLGDVPPAVERISRNSTKYITAVSFEQTPTSKTKDKWFRGEVPLNPGLVAVIGNKGAGKSALADIIALLGNSHRYEHFPFLNDRRFLHPRSRLGESFRATARWGSGYAVSKRLDERPDRNQPELVKYIPQNFLETICGSIEETGFERELKHVIFTHIDPANRLGKASLDDLISYLTEAVEDEIHLLRNELSDVNDQVVELERKRTDEYRAQLKGLLDLKRAELEALDEARPQEVPKPEADPKLQKDAERITAELDEMRTDLKKLERLIEDQEGVLRKATQQIASAHSLLGRLDNLKKQIETFYAEAQGDALLIGVDIRQVAELKVDRTPIERALKAAQEAVSDVQVRLDEKRAESLSARRAALKAAIEKKQLELDEPNRKYQKYLDDLEQWKQQRALAVGSADIPGTLTALEARLKELDDLPQRLDEAYQHRRELCRQIISAKQKLLDSYRELYEPVQKSISAGFMSGESPGLELRAVLGHSGFVDGLLDHVHQGRTGSFYGESDGRSLAERLVREATLDDPAGVLAFVERVMDHLRYDRRDGKDTPVRVEDQLLQGRNLKELYDYLYGLEYLRPAFELRWQGKPLAQLSAGERGTLMLIFYLLVDRSDVPLIIDQPEENLDNQTIVGLLVPAIRRAKAKRQIIIVTHNPNLAVVCDAEQIVHAKCDKVGEDKITYTSGAIENPQITQLILDILEGTKPAFDLRDSKYDILERVPANDSGSQSGG